MKPLTELASLRTTHGREENEYESAFEPETATLWGYFNPQGAPRFSLSLLADIRARLPLEADAEITLEANPGTFEKDRFKAFRQAGVNRLSIGVQSFDDTKLKALGRVHNREQAMAAEIGRAHV